MKTSELKQLIKEAVRDAIRDEMKDILLEALRSPKTTIQETRSTIGDPVNGNLGSGELGMDQIMNLLNGK